MLFITCKREKILHFFSLREKEDLIDLLRDMVGEIGLDCNSTELNDLYSELCNGLKGIKTSKSLDVKILIYFNEGDLDFVCHIQHIFYQKIQHMRLHTKTYRSSC